MALWLHFFGQCLDIIVCWPLCFGWTCVSPSSSVSLAKLAEGLLAQVFRAPRGMLCFVILLLTCEHNVMLGLRGLPSDQSWDFDKLCSVLSLTHSIPIITDIFSSWWDFSWCEYAGRPWWWWRWWQWWCWWWSWCLSPLTHESVTFVVPTHGGPQWISW